MLLIRCIGINHIKNLVGGGGIPSPLAPWLEVVGTFGPTLLNIVHQNTHTHSHTHIQYTSYTHHTGTLTFRGRDPAKLDTW